MLRQVSRFTPTLVGKTVEQPVPSDPKEVHPHACGENIAERGLKLDFVGSPPRLWGKRRIPPKFIESPRFTPTLVGKTIHRLSVHNRKRVHPHACGENKTPIMQQVFRAGSPPRLWGKRCSRRYTNLYDRFTPTLVGKTIVLQPAHSVSAVHPHACGENNWAELGINWHKGSPPRLWGKRYIPNIPNSLNRFTPTLVGKTTEHNYIWTGY